VYKNLWLLLSLLALILLLVGFFLVLRLGAEYSQKQEIPQKVEMPQEKQDSLDLGWFLPADIPAKTKRVLVDLISCESHGVETAVNPKDRDGTASYGLLQFKPTTLYWVLTEYDIMTQIEEKEVLNVIYDGNVQIRAFLAYYGEGRPVSWWRQQFPACSKRYNYWQDVL
jgi:hypothetical protein